MNNISSLGWYNHGHSALVLHNYNKLTIRGPFLVPFHLVLNLAPKIQSTPSPHLGQGLAFRFASYRLGSDPSLAHNYDKCAHRGLPTYRNYKTIVGVSMYISTANDNCLSCVSLLSNRLHTIKQVLHSALLAPLFSTALAQLLPSSLQTLDSDPCHHPSLCILCTILPRMPLAAVPCPTSSFAFLNTDYIVARGFVELPTQGLVSGSHVISSPFLMLQPKWKVYVVIVPSSSVVPEILQTMHDAIHLSTSY